MYRTIACERSLKTLIFSVYELLLNRHETSTKLSASGTSSSRRRDPVASPVRGIVGSPIPTNTPWITDHFESCQVSLRGSFLYASNIIPVLAF